MGEKPEPDVQINQLFTEIILGSWHIGGQILARGVNNGKFIDGLGFAQYEIMEGFFAGAALIKHYLAIISSIMKDHGLTGQPTIFLWEQNILERQSI